MRNNLLLFAFAANVIGKPVPAQNDSVVSTTVCNGQSFEYLSMAGFGFVPFDAKDSKGESIGGMGSSATIDHQSWFQVEKGKYEGDLYALPDRGFNVNGTLNYQPRVHKFKVTLDTTQTTGSVNNTNVQLQYQKSIFLTDPSGTPMTGLDADVTNGNHSSFKGFSDLPVVHYVGDGFGFPGPGGVRVPLDSEGIIFAKDGTYWISDEYGPYIYQFDPNGKMLQAIRPPDAFIPMRGGLESFSADSPPIYAPTVEPSPHNPQSGRQNNQGFEGLTMSPDNKKLWTLLQSALRQDGGNGGSSNRYYTRLLEYDITNKGPKLVAEYVVKLPIEPDGKTTAAQSEIHYISDTQFFILSRDSGAGQGQSTSQSVYRHADIFDISGATNILGQFDSANSSITTDATSGILKSGITPATYCSFLDYNNNAQLNRFGVHNGGAFDRGLLNEKWESIAIVPVKGSDSEDEYFLFSLSDNDFRALDVYVGGHVFHDVVNLDNQVLVFKIKLPSGAKPYVG